MVDKQENPMLSIQLASGSTAVIPRNVELTERENVNYGEKWHRIETLLGQVQERIDSTVERSAPEDVSVARSISELLQTAATDDRICLFHQEIDGILKKAEVEKWEAQKLGLHFALLASAYNMDYEELTEQFTKRRLAAYRLSNIPSGHFRFDRENVANVNLHGFTNIEVNTTNNNPVIEMKPVYDGGNDNLTYPLHSAKLLVTNENVISLELGTVFFRSHELNEEIWNHPEIIDFIKGGFEKVIKKYTHDRETFIDERNGRHGKTDTTQLFDQLFDFMENDYLKRRLDRSQYRQFQQRLKYVDSDNVAAVTSIRAIAENILDDESYLRTGYYAKKSPQDLERIVQRTQATLENLGCKIENGVFTNFFEIVDKAARDRKFANRVNTL